MNLREDDTCPECLGDGKDPLDPRSSCPLCGGDGRMSLGKALDNLAERIVSAADEQNRFRFRPGEQN